MIPIHVRAHAQTMRSHRLRIVPYTRSYYLVEIVGHGWTQADLHPLDVDYMARDWLACTYNTNSKDYELQIEYIVPVSNGTRQVCPYCGNPYDQKTEGRHHFIPCDICDSLEHSGCLH